MAGEARTSEFLLSTATLMIGPRKGVMELTPDDHSLGLIKNVQVSADLGFTELTQGVQNIPVASVNTSNTSKISAELYEFSAPNLAYGAGLDGATFETKTDSFALAADTTVAAGNAAKLTLAVGSGAKLGAGDYIVIQDQSEPDNVHVGKVGSIANDIVTLAAGYELPLGRVMPKATTIVYAVNAIPVGGVTKQPYFGAKLVGIMPETEEPVTLIFPKIKITKGIGLAFQSDNFSNMPFEFTPYPLLRGEPYRADFGANKTWKLLKR